jgi:hypothetical protein
MQLSPLSAAHTFSASQKIPSTNLLEVQGLVLTLCLHAGFFHGKELLALTHPHWQTLFQLAATGYSKYSQLPLYLESPGWNLSEYLSQCNYLKVFLFTCWFLSW